MNSESRGKNMPGTQFSVEIRPVLPERLRRLEELTNDLYYSWDRNVRRLFRHLDQQTWLACRRNPKVFLRRVGQKRLDAAARDPIFLSDYRSTLSAYDTYMQERPMTELDTALDVNNDLVAYFSAEFGFHQSVPIYAGGLGILAGDYCKSMSNLWVPFVGVGLLYREGYFTQRLLQDGTQLADYPHVYPDDLPVSLATDAKGQDLNVVVHIADRPVKLKVWEARAGHIRLILLDTDVPENSPQERAITSKLYGGDSSERIQQEIVLGIGGVRALRAMGLSPTVWHINEGHAAFQILERCREHVRPRLDFNAALQLVAGSTVFTTHTPVPAGHDIFTKDLVHTHFADFMKQLGIDEAHFYSLASDDVDPNGFNMTTLALRGSRFRNGVSRIHGAVASEMARDVWPGVPVSENPVGYVTNGVDVDSFLGLSWVALFDMYLGRGWRAKLTDRQFWKTFIAGIPNHVYRSVRQVHKDAMLAEIQQRIVLQLQRSGCVDSVIRETTRQLVPDNRDVLVIGFARRFATYKRATLLLMDLERLARLLNDPQRPVLIVFAGKAHPNDGPGQQLIREIAAVTMRPEFRGRILLLEDYNLSMGRDLYPGVDVWLNVPEYPKEACGTSGMKAALNGAINLSVLDGWWGEAYNGDNGWAITPHPELDADVRNQHEAGELLDILEHQVIPLYFARNREGEPEQWINKSKASMQTALLDYNGIRMAIDYLRGYYGPAALQGKRLAKNNAAGAVELADWCNRISMAWPKVKIRLEKDPCQAVNAGDAMPIAVRLELNGLSPGDVQVECVVGENNRLNEFVPSSQVLLQPVESDEKSEILYQADLSAADTDSGFEGLRHFKVRVYPHHELLTHRFECGLMLWL
jgi:starch phosphorylase